MIFNMSGGSCAAGSGTGAGLNCRVIGRDVAPSNPMENTIWINTDTPISSWMFSTTQPTNPEDNMVWIKVGTISQVEFNILKKNGIQLHPNLAFQYISGEWKVKTAKTWQGGGWVDWAWYMFKEGSGFAEGFTGFSADWVAGEITCTDNLITIPLYKKEGYTSNSFIAKEPVNLTNYNTAYLSGLTSSHSGASGYSTSIWYGFATNSNDVVKREYIDTSTGSNGTYISDGTLSIDISSLSGEFYLAGGYSCSDEDETHFTTIIKNIYFI